MGASVYLGVSDADPDFTGATALHFAAYAGHFGVVRVLLAAGARVDQCASNGTNALHWVARNGSADVLALLLQSPTAAIDAHSAVFDYTALHWATDRSQGKSVEMLVAAGADLIVRDAAGRTPLVLAASGGVMSALEVLMQHSTAADLVETAATVHANSRLDATKKQDVLYMLARKAADKDPAAAAAAASAHASQPDLVQIFLQAQGDAGKAKDQVIAAAEATNI